MEFSLVVADDAGDVGHTTITDCELNLVHV